MIERNLQFSTDDRRSNHGISVREYIMFLRIRFSRHVSRGKKSPVQLNNPGNERIKRVLAEGNGISDSYQLALATWRFCSLGPKHD